MTDKEYKKRLNKIKEENKDKHRQLKLQKEKNKYNKNYRKTSSSKMYLLVVFLICVEIMIFAEVASLKLNDSAPLVSLVAIPVTLVPALLGYYKKATAENTKGGIVYDNNVNSDDDEEAQG